MNKKVFFFFILILLLLGYIFKIDKIIKIQFLYITNEIKTTYKYIIDTNYLRLNKYFNQINNIDDLQKANKKNQQFELLYKVKQKELDQLQNINFSEINNNMVHYVGVLSYENINDFSKVILDTNITKEGDIFALATTNGYSAGIVINEDNQNIAYLNPHEKCNYAVYIGEELAPGITSGENQNGEVIINFIPKWYNIKVGDRVITSGMDDIFAIGLRVGIVSSIKSNANTKTAFIKPHDKVLNKKYFYIIKK